jgi:hypothetical protein
MAVELITENHGLEMDNLFKSTNRRILIISPFLGLKTCEKLANAITDNALKCKIITRFYREDFIEGASNLNGILSLLESGAELRALVGLHTKLYLFDDFCSIITSANYTYGGLYSNIELGVKIENEDDINLKCEEYFNNLWNEIESFNKKNANKAIITKEMVEKEKEIVNKVASTRTKATANFNPYKQGAELPKIETSDIIEKAFVKEAMSSQSHKNGGLSAWLKFEADSQNRYNAELKYDSSDEFTKDKTFFPTHPAGVKNGDRIFIAVVSYDKDNVPTPVIVGRAYTTGFDKNNEMTKGMKGWKDYMSIYPYFIKLHDKEILNTPVKNGISLLDMYRQLGGKTYPSTVDKNISFEKLRTYHYQKDKIGITEYAEDYLNTELDKLFNKYGKESI